MVTPVDDPGIPIPDGLGCSQGGLKMGPLCQEAMS